MKSIHKHLLDDFELAGQMQGQRPQSIFVLDGPDGCGKTNIVQEMSRRMGIPYFKNKGEWANFEKDNDYFVNCMKYGDLGVLSQFLKQTGHSAVFDRSWPSEFVYSSVFDRKTDHSVLRQLDDTYRDLGARMIICLRKSYDGCTDQFESITPQRLKEIHDGYLVFCEWTTCPVLKLWVDDEDLEREMSDIRDFIRSSFPI